MKLKLNRETLRELDVDQMREAKGATGPRYTETCVITFTCTQKATLGPGCINVGYTLVCA